MSSSILQYQLHSLKIACICYKKKMIAKAKAICQQLIMKNVKLKFPLKIAKTNRISIFVT